MLRELTEQEALYPDNWLLEVDRRRPLYHQDWREMPSDPPPPAQWNIQGWMAAYHQAVRNGQPPPTSPNPPAAQAEGEPVAELTGGWQYEGKEPPVAAKICVKCQGNRTSNTPTDEYDKSLWCEPCLEGKLLGHPPKKPKAAKSSPLKEPNKPDSTINHSAFFGG